MRSLALLLLFTILQSAPATKKEQERSQKESSLPRQSSKPASETTAPVAVQNVSTSDQKDKSKEESKWSPPPSFWDIYWPTVALVIGTGFVVAYAIKTLRAIRDQVVEIQATGRQTDQLIRESIAQTQSLSRQADSLAKSSYHLGESANATYQSASAMERIAEKIAASTEAANSSVSAINKQMRAYLFVLVGSGTVQDRATNVRFAASPTLRNAGNTPAYKLSYKIKTAILPIPLPGDFTFPLPNEAIEGNPLGAHQDATMNAFADDFCPDEEVESIKVGGKGRVLYVWGIVTYKDVFGENHSTKFCHTVNFVRLGTEDRVIGFYIGRHEEAD